MGFEASSTRECTWVLKENALGKDRDCHMSTGTWSELSLMITPSFVAGLSQVRPDRLIERSRGHNISRDKSMY